jgi:hypothetical protein
MCSPQAKRSSNSKRLLFWSRAGEIPNGQSSTWGTPKYSVWLVCSPAPACGLNDSMSEMRTKVDSWAHSDTTRHCRPDLRGMANSAMARVRVGGSVPQWIWERSCHKRHFCIFEEDDPPPNCRSSGLNQASVPGHLPICPAMALERIEIARHTPAGWFGRESQNLIVAYLRFGGTPN